MSAGLSFTFVYAVYNSFFPTIYAEQINVDADHSAQEEQPKETPLAVASKPVTTRKYTPDEAAKIILTNWKRYVLRRRIESK